MVKMGFLNPNFRTIYMVDFFNYHRNFFNATEIRKSQHVDKPLKCKLVFTNEMKGDLKTKSRRLTNSQVVLATHNTIPVMCKGLPKPCKRHGNGGFVVTEKIYFYTTTVTRGKGEGKQPKSCRSLNRSTKRDFCEYNTTNNIYDNLLNSDFLWEAY